MSESVIINQQMNDLKLLNKDKGNEAYRRIEKIIGDKKDILHKSVCQLIIDIAVENDTDEFKMSKIEDVLVIVRQWEGSFTYKTNRGQTYRQTVNCVKSQYEIQCEEEYASKGKYW